MLRNARITAITVCELLMEKQQGKTKRKTTHPVKVNKYAHKNTLFQFPEYVKKLKKLSVHVPQNDIYVKTL